MHNCVNQSTEEEEEEEEGRKKQTRKCMKIKWRRTSRKGRRMR
jgi:hypothetical protein